MKLLIYSHFFAPSVGGVETIVQSLALGLSELRDESGAREFEITLVTRTPAGNYEDSSLPFRVLRKPGIFQLWRLIHSSDVVHLAGPALAPLLLTHLVQKPIVIEHHGYQATCPNGLLFHHPTKTVCKGHFEAGNYVECLNCNTKTEGGLRALWLLASTFLRREGSRSASRNIAPSHHVAVRQSLPRTMVIPHGVQQPLNTNEAETELQQAERNSFAYVGRLVIEKGVSVLLEAARLLRAEVRNVRVLLVGDGPERPHLERQITASHLESFVRITGFLSGSALQCELRDAGTIVIPTIMEETAGLAALEQMARGRLVIASAVGGLKEIVEGVGLTFPVGDSPALAQAMRRILDEPNLVSSLGAMGRQRVLQSFSFSAMIDAHALVYREMHATART